MGVEIDAVKKLSGSFSLKIIDIGPGWMRIPVLAACLLGRPVNREYDHCANDWQQPDQR